MIAITPFLSKDEKVYNQAYATILKFFENDIEYATEMTDSITENVGHDALIEIKHYKKESHSLRTSNPKADDNDDNEDNGNTVFRYYEFYKFPQSDKTGKKTYDTLTVKIDNALSLQKNTTQSHKLQNDQGKTMIAKDSFVPLL